MGTGMETGTGTGTGRGHLGRPTPPRGASREQGRGSFQALPGTQSIRLSPDVANLHISLLV